MRKKIVICGGHLAPAVAVIEELEKRGGWEIFFLGRKHAFEKGKFISLEYQTIKKMGISFFTVETSRLGRFVSLRNLFSLIKFPFSLLKQFKLLKKIKPEVILSFGGYLALPVCLAGWLLGVPVVTHEQTLRQGLANWIIALFARKVLMGWREGDGGFGGVKGKVEWVGNPVRREILNPKHQILNKFKTPEKKLPLIYITGGSTGAHAINKAVLEVLPKLLEKYRLIHQCGESECEDYQKLKAKSLKLKANLRRRYLLTKYVNIGEVGEVMRKADIIIGRAGANTVTEIAILGKPAILIPLPWAAVGEQLANAEKLARYGGIIILRQENLTGGTLYQYINILIENLKKYRENAYRFSQNEEVKKHFRAASYVVSFLERLASHRRTSFKRD